MTVSIHQLLVFILTATAVTVAALWTQADTKTFHQVGDYTIHYAVFNSTMVQAKTANAHSLRRANNLAYINIAVVDNTNEHRYGIEARVSGQSRNLLQQQQLLRFVAIEEQNTTYYLAPLHHNNEDVYHFDIDIDIDRQAPISFTFTKTLYVENRQ